MFQLSGFYCKPLNPEPSAVHAAKENVSYINHDKEPCVG